jgi:hypothetical protein
MYHIQGWIHWIVCFFEFTRVQNELQKFAINVSPILHFFILIIGPFLVRTSVIDVIHYDVVNS